MCHSRLILADHSGGMPGVIGFCEVRKMTLVQVDSGNQQRLVKVGVSELYGKLKYR